MSIASRFHRLALTAAVAASVALAAPASAQPVDGGGDEEVAVGTFVAKALVDRGMVLFRERDYNHARQLFIEALERDPSGPHAGSALTMLRRSNSKLGRYKDDGVPSATSSNPPSGGDTVIDPYAGGGDGGAGDGGGGDSVIDPYAGGDGGAGGGGDTVIDPYAGGGDGGGGTAGPIDTGEPRRGTASDTRREMLIWSGSYGFLTGLAIAGDSDSAALIGLLGGAGGVGISHWVTRRFDLPQGAVSAIETAGTWGAVNAAFLGHLIDGTDSEYTGAEATRYAAVGGALGIAAGALWAKRGDPDPNHIAFANSLAAYGAAAGLFLGVAIDPPEDEAYTLNGAIGSTVGLAAGLFLAPKLELSRRRTLKMDLGAAIGAGAPWALLYPLLKDETTNDDEQTVGVVSVLTMGGGAYLAWRLTRGSDDRADEELAPAPVPAVARRDAAGRWSFGLPLPRPMEDPALAPPTGELNLGVDLLGGHF